MHWCCMYTFVKVETILISILIFFFNWKSPSCVWLFVIPGTITCQAALSMEFSRQEYCGGWPLPSPGDPPNPGAKHRSPALQKVSLPTEPPAKPKNTGVGSLSLLQEIFPTQESNWLLLHCRQIEGIFCFQYFFNFRFNRKTKSNIMAIFFLSIDTKMIWKMLTLQEEEMMYLEQDFHGEFSV